MAIRITHPTPPNYLIAADALAHARPIEEVAEDMGLPTDPSEFYNYGHRIAKIDGTQAARHLRQREDGHLVLVTAMTPTPKGSGKTLTTIALVDALNRLFKTEGKKPGQRATAVLREPSMGPVFGMKGGAAGGGYSQVIPMDDINLHFTGDIHAVGAAHNLLFAMAMAYIYDGKNKHGVNLKRFIWPRAVDMVDRSLRELHLSASGEYKDTEMRLRTHYVITAASEIMATLGMASDMDELRDRLSRVLLGYYADGNPLTARDLDAVNPMLTILLHAFNPNLVQTLFGNGVFIHTGPFANIAHGNASMVAMKLGIKACDYVLTEGGFAADLGAQKFFDIVCRAGKLTPAAAVIVCSTRDLKHQGGMSPMGTTRVELKRMRFDASVDGCMSGMWNLRIHVENLQKYGVPVVVAINRFGFDTEEEIAAIIDCVENKLGVSCVAHNGYGEGPDGALRLAKRLVQTVEEHTEKREAAVAAKVANPAVESPAAPAPASAAEGFRFLYPEALPVKRIIETVAHEIYRSGDILYSRGVAEKLARIEEMAGPLLNVCMSKTQFSLTDNPNYFGDPRGKPLTVTDVRYAGGPGWVVALCGKVFEMPGMNFVTCGARQLEIARDDTAFGGFMVKNLG